MATDVKRKGRLNVRLDEAMISKLETIATEMGIPSSTLGAVAIAEYVNGKLAVQTMQDKVAVATAEKNAEILNRMIEDPATLKLLASTVEAQHRLEGV